MPDPRSNIHTKAVRERLLAGFARSPPSAQRFPPARLLIALLFAFCSGGFAHSALVLPTRHREADRLMIQRQLIEDQRRTLAGMQALNDALKLKAQLAASKCGGKDI